MRTPRIAIVLLMVGAAVPACSSDAWTDDAERGVGTDAQSSDEGDAGDEGDGLGEDDAGATTPTLEDPAPARVDEESSLTVTLVQHGIERFDALGLPPGARFDGTRGAFSFRPDFTQSGSYDVAITGHGGGGFTKTVHLKVEVIDTVAPPAPTVVSTEQGSGFTRLVVRQTTDAFLDSPGNAGRTFDAVVVIPSSATPAAKAPVVIGLHGFGGAPSRTASSTTNFRIEPHDPANTYWYGYADSLPGSVAGAKTVPPYTLRRVLHLLDWLLETYPSADADRVFASGGSMGGAGAMALGLLFGRHFAGVESTMGQAVARNHRPSRVRTQAALWGSPEQNIGGVWDTLDLTRALRDDPEAQDVFLFTKHGKDDPTIHFGAAVLPSPLTKKSLYGTLEEGRLGHYAVWDEGAHGPLDPVMGASWWDASWSRVTSKDAFLSRRAPFPAFSRSGANGKPGDGSGNGKRAFDAEKGFAGTVTVAGDTGWAGDIAGALNRFLRWDTTKAVDTPERLELHLRIVTAPGEAPPRAGYPTRRDRFDGTSITTDVTPRRVRAFRPNPGEEVRWTFGEKNGAVTVAGDGTITVPSLAIGTTWTPLVFERSSR